MRARLPLLPSGHDVSPVRERSADNIVDAVVRGLDETGYDEVSLTSLSSTDHSQIAEILTRVNAACDGRGIRVSVPSQRLDSFGVEMAGLVAGQKKGGLTFAPEAGTQRLRDVINKNVTEDDLFSAIDAAFQAGWRRCKLYFSDRPSHRDRRGRQRESRASPSAPTIAPRPTSPPISAAACACPYRARCSSRRPRRRSNGTARSRRGDDAPCRAAEALGQVQGGRRALPRSQDQLRRGRHEPRGPRGRRPRRVRMACRRALRRLDGAVQRAGLATCDRRGRHRSRGHRAGELRHRLRHALVAYQRRRLRSVFSRSSAGALRRRRPRPIARLDAARVAAPARLSASTTNWRSPASQAGPTP